ncbi:MAG: hypothetical protein KGI75_01255 [Rhizobiaceae bacterium]|nr:hypothetical protein [Rhizobiaceae bacterium]
MDKGGGSEKTSEKAEQRGLWKLMLKLPALRGRLQLVAAHSQSVRGLCEAYDEASSMLERLRNSRVPSDKVMIAEYENICSEIETEIIQYFLNSPPGVPK